MSNLGLAVSLKSMADQCNGCAFPWSDSVYPLCTVAYSTPYDSSVIGLQQLARITLRFSK